MKYFFKIFKEKQQEIQDRNHFRDLHQETAVFDHFLIVAFVLIGVLFSLFAIYRSNIPPPDIAKTILSQPQKFLSFPETKVFFSSAKDPAEFQKLKKYPVSLPYRNLARMEGYHKEKIWYELDVSIPENRFTYGKTALLLPLVWGEGKVFVDGVLYSYGNNHWPLVGITKREVKIFIHSDLSQSSREAPLSATYPPVAADEIDLVELKAVVQAQSLVNQASHLPFLIAISFIGAFFLAYRKRPELLAFLGFLVFSYLYAFAEQKEASGKLLFDQSSFQTMFFLSVDYLMQVFLILFSYLFFRVSFKKAIGALVFPVFSSAVLGLAVSTVAFHWGVGPSSFRQVGHITLSIFFGFLQCKFLLPEVWHVVSDSGANALRKISALLVVVSIVSVYILNIIDYFGLFSALTTQYQNGFLIYFVLSMIVAFEASRAEGQKRRMSMLLSSEAKRAVEQGRDEEGGEGFVILVDAINFTLDRDAFLEPEEMRKSAEEIFGPVASAICRSKVQGISLLCSTGDGLYFSLKGPPDRKGFDRAIAVAQEIVRLSENSKLRLRVAVGYGSYIVFLFHSGHFQKELVFGGVLNDLGRVIGGDSIRILMSPEIQFLMVHQGLEIFDKHGHVHRYCELPKAA